VPAPLLVLGSAVSVQSGSALAKSLFQTLGPPGVVFLRLLFGTILLCLATRPRPRNWTRHQVILAAALGTTLACLNLTFYEAIARTPLGIAVALEFVGPLAVAVVGSRRALDLLWVVLAGGAVALLAQGGGYGGSTLGVALSLLAGGFWAVYIVLGVRIGRTYRSNSVLFPAMATGSLWLLPWGTLGAGSHLLEPRLLLEALGVGALSSAIPWTLELTAMRYVSARVFGILVSLTPAVAAVSGFVLLGQRLRPLAWTALALVIVASAGALRERSEPMPPEA